ncbi:MAG TPA: peptidylprolyl isomerase [Oligoflexia bacterium]|nr:peptidylprolyl isomerase [Oligoflexia bacterium]HMR25625.1 peptidylprolyl isomerase [Oligoflexia bacterium]
MRSQRDEVLAYINDRDVTVRDFQMALSKVSEIPIKNYEKQENRTDLLRDLIDEELLYQEAVKSKIYERSYEVKQAMVRGYLKERYNAKLAGVTDKEVSEFYQQNKDIFDQVKASHILIRTGEGSGRTEAEAESLIKKIRSSYLNNPKVENFAKLAKQYSEDPGTKNNGGDLGFFNGKTMVKAFTDTSFALAKVGDVSDIVKTEFGYHLIVLTGDKRGLKHYEKDIRQHLVQQKNRTNLESELAQLRSKASIKVLQDNLAKLAKQ